MNWRKNVLLEEVKVESTATPSVGGASPSAPTAPVTDVPAAPAAVVADNASETPSDVDWLEESNLEEEASPAKPAADAAKPAVDPAKPAIPAVVVPAAAAPVVAPVVDPAKPAVPAAEPAKPAPKVAETPEAKTAREAAEKASEEKLFSGLVDFYKLPDDMAAKLTTEPENVLPYLAARVHRSIMEGVIRVLHTQLPQHIDTTIAVREAEGKSKSAFFDRWPTLKPYEAQVLQAGQLYRSLNPTATQAQAIEAIGDIVSKSLGVAVAAPAAGAPAKPAASAAPFKPAGSSASAAAPAPTSENEFEKFATEED